MEEKRLIRFDWAIKNILRNKVNFDILEGFLTALLRIDIRIIQILESESNQAQREDKFNRVDLLVEASKGEKIIIEIQNEREVHYLERLLFGTSKLIVENLNLGRPYGEIKKVISVNILYFFLGEGTDDYVYYGKTEFRGIHSNTVLKLKRKQEKAISVIEAGDIFPEYYLIEVEKFQDIIQSDLDEWIYFLKHETIRDDFKAKNIDKAKEKLDYLKLSKEERKKYERYMENLAREKDMIESARDEGLDEGLEKGRKEGLEEGEKKKSFESAQKMLKDGLDIELISKYTGVSINDIENLSKNVIS